MSFVGYIILPLLSFLLFRRYLLKNPSNPYKSDDTVRATHVMRERTREEIYYTAFLLRQKLPAELVPAILDHAECWVKTASIVERDLSVTEIDIIKRDDGNGGTRDEGVPYLFTDPIGMEGLSGLHPVRKVVFTIESSDQGYSWDREWHGTYNHSWTWFEAVVLEFDEEDDAALREGKRILCNLHASIEPMRHVVEWDLSSDERENVFSEGGEADWVKRLVRGQRIGITVWAQFNGWTNIVRSAKIEVFTAAVR
jgi:hypothetical protein